MILAARSRRPAYDGPREGDSRADDRRADDRRGDIGLRRHETAVLLARRAHAWLRRQFGVREFVCGAFGEFLGLQTGMAVSFNLINQDLIPEAAHHLAWSLSLALGALLGGVMGWWVARVSRQEPQRVRVK